MVPPVVRFAQDNSPVACGAPLAASLKCRQVKPNTIPTRTPANETSIGADLQRDDARHTQRGLSSFTRWETLLSSYWSLRERNSTLSTFFLKNYSYMSQYFIAYFSSSVLFLISIIPKSGQDGKKLFVWGCELLLNCIFSESYFRAVTHADACTASDTDSSNAVNSPGSIFLACFFSEDLMWSLCCWMSQSRCLVMAPS